MAGKPHSRSVKANDPALEPGQLHDIGGTQVRDTHRVPHDLRRHSESRRRPQPCQRSTSIRAVTLGRLRTRYGAPV